METWKSDAAVGSSASRKKRFQDLALCGQTLLITGADNERSAQAHTAKDQLDFHMQRLGTIVEKLHFSIRKSDIVAHMQPPGANYTHNVLGRFVSNLEWRTEKGMPLLEAPLPESKRCLKLRFLKESVSRSSALWPDLAYHWRGPQMMTEVLKLTLLRTNLAVELCLAGSLNLRWLLVLDT